MKLGFEPGGCYMDVFLFSVAWQVGVSIPCLYLELRYWRQRNVPVKGVLATLAAEGGGLGPTLVKFELDRNRIAEIARDPAILTTSSAAMMSSGALIQLLLLPCWLSSSPLLKQLAYVGAIGIPVLQAATGSVWITNIIIVKSDIVRELKLVYPPNSREYKKLKSFYSGMSPLMRTPDHVKRTLRRLEPDPYYEILLFSSIIPAYIGIIAGYLIIKGYFPDVLALARKIGTCQIVSLPVTEALTFYSLLCSLFAVSHVPITVPLIYLFIRMSPYTQYKIIKKHIIFIPQY